MNDVIIQTLQTLSNTLALSGHEGAVRQVLRPLLKNHVDEMRTDSLGNLITLKQGTGESSLRVMVSAHTDEVGLMVMDHTSDGGLRIDAIGSVNSHLLPGLHVFVGEDKLPGVIGIQAIHRAKSMSKVPKLEKLVVDIGAKSKEEASNLAPIGTPIAFATQFKRLGPTVAGKAFDDRVGCTVLLSILRGERLPFDLYGVFTAQEEVGLRGARVAAYTIEPDAAIALESTVADDFPRPKDVDVSPTTEIGKGPAITVMDRSYITSPRLLRLTLQSAEAEGIPYQLKQPGVSTTESGVTHDAKGGVQVITISVPTRYIHSPVALINLEDLDNTIRLVRATLERMTPEHLSFK